MMKNFIECRLAWNSPHDISVIVMQRQLDILAHEVVKHRMATPQFPELVEDQSNRGLSAFVRILLHDTSGSLDISRRRIGEHFATLRLIQATTFQTDAHGM